MKARFRISKLSLRRFGKRLMKALRLRKGAERAFCLTPGLCLAAAFFAFGAFPPEKASAAEPLTKPFRRVGLFVEAGEGRGEADFAAQEQLARLCAPPPFALSPPLYKAQRANQAIRLIKTSAGEGLGTGFFIRPRLLLTNFHVINGAFDRAGENGENETLFLFSHAQDAELIKVKSVRALDPLYDLALLETERESPYLSLAEKAAEEEDSLFASGYFGGTFQTVRKTGPLKQLDGSFVFPVNWTPYLYFERGGESGSPVLTAEGRVVGAISQNTGNFQAAVNLFHLRGFTENRSGFQCGASGAQDCLESALNFLNKEAETGRLPALYELGQNLLDKAESPEDWERPDSLLRQAAEGGSLMSVYALSFFPQLTQRRYESERLYWLKRAAAAGMTPAARWLADMMQRLSGKEQKKAAAYWMRQAAEGGDSEAQYQLSLLSGNESLKAPEDALSLRERLYWLKQAAENSHVPAVQSLARICYEGRGGLEPDFEGAAYWFKQASDRLRSVRRSFNR